MKTYTAKVVLLLAVVLSVSAAGTAQFVIKVRPAAPVVRVRPAAPAPGHIWIGGNYTWRGNHYVYTDGYWAAPRMGCHWVDGHWKRRRGGWVWVPGHWRK